MVGALSHAPAGPAPLFASRALPSASARVSMAGASDGGGGPSGGASRPWAALDGAPVPTVLGGLRPSVGGGRAGSARRGPGTARDMDGPRPSHFRRGRAETGGGRKRVERGGGWKRTGPLVVGRRALLVEVQPRQRREA